MKKVSLLIASLLIAPFASAYELSEVQLRPQQVLKAEVPVVHCANGLMSAKVFALPNEVDAEIVIESVIGKSFMSHQLAQTAYTLEGTQAFVSAESSLVIVETDDGIQGVLTFNRHQTGLQQVMDCQAFYEIQPVAAQL